MLRPGPYLRFHAPTATASLATGAIAAAGVLLAARVLVDDVAVAPWTRLGVAFGFLALLVGFAVNGYRNERWLARRGEVVRVTVLGGDGADDLLATALAARRTGEVPAEVHRVPRWLAAPALLWHGGRGLPALVVNGRLIHQGAPSPPVGRVRAALGAAHRAVDPGAPDEDPAGAPGW